MDSYNIKTITSNFKTIKISNDKSIIFYKNNNEYYRLYTKIRSGTDQIITQIYTITQIKFTVKKDYRIYIIQVNIPQEIATIINNYIQDCCDICNKHISTYTANIGQAHLYLCHTCLLENMLRLLKFKI